MKVLFAGTPEFSVPPLMALEKEHDIIGVFTQPDRKSGRGKKLTPPPVKVAAQQLGIGVYQPESLKDQADLISQLNPDVMVVVAYGMLLPQKILDIPKYGCINIHASLLPRWRGAAPIQRAIEAGDKESGVSIMQMELGLDTGPVFLMLKTPITESDTSATLHDKLSELGARGIVDTLRSLQSDSDTKQVIQDDSHACYAKKIRKSEAAIDWSLSANEIQQKIRAFIPFPISQCSHQQTRLRIWQAKVTDTNGGHGEPGTVTDIDDNGLYVACGQGVLRLETLQRDGGKAIPWQQFTNGYQIEIGDQLG